MLARLDHLLIAVIRCLYSENEVSIFSVGHGRLRRFGLVASNNSTVIDVVDDGSFATIIAESRIFDIGGHFYGNDNDGYE